VNLALSPCVPPVIEKFTPSLLAVRSISICLFLNTETLSVLVILSAPIFFSSTTLIVKDGGDSNNYPVTIRATRDKETVEKILTVTVVSEVYITNSSDGPLGFEFITVDDFKIRAVVDGKSKGMLGQEKAMNPKSPSKPSLLRLPT
jgi:hypothetical protein